MSMQLHHPSLSTTGKRKGKKKFASAAAKQMATQLEQDWKDLKTKWGVDADTKKRNRAMSAAPLSNAYILKVPEDRNTAHIKSLGEDNGVAALAPAKVYSGTKVIGIATMHKSNAVPVFSNEEAVDISTMRR